MMLIPLFFYAGLLLWAISDWRTSSVPAGWFELWCGLLYLLAITHGQPWWPPLLWGIAAYLLAISGWLGSADAWLIAVLATRFGFEAMLWLLLFACFTGIIHATIANTRALPWLPHLALGAVMVSVFIT